MFQRRRSLLEKYIFSPNEIPGQLDNVKSIKFDGVDSHVVLPNAANLKPVAFSVSFWFKDAPGSPLTYDTFVSNVNNDAWAGWGVFVDALPTRIGFFSDVFTGTPTGAAYHTYPNDGAWHHVVGTASGSQTILYLDGVASTPVSRAVVHSPYWPLIGGARSGILAPGLPGYFTNANIDEVTFWNAVLTPQDVLDLYNGKKPTNPIEHAKSANLVSWWRMGDNDTFPTVRDNVDANNGTLINGVAGDIQNEVP
jgi:hypothetical protein